MDRRDASEAYLQPPLSTFPQAPEGEMAWRNPDLQTPHGEMASWFPKFLQSLFPGGGNRDTAETLGNLLTFGAAIGVPGGAPKSKPHPKPVDLRKIANDYARFVMGKAPVEPKESDPRIIKELESLGQRAISAPHYGYDSTGSVRAYQELVPPPRLSPDRYRLSTENPGRYEMRIPDIRSANSSFSSPMLSLKSEAWRAPHQDPTWFNDILDRLAQRGLWP